MNNQIQKTNNYGKFKTIRGNRGINRKYLTKLAESIKDNNLLPSNPIIVNERMQVIDGQHRLKVAEMLGIDIYYTVVATGSLSDVQMLNTNIRQWTLGDFLESYIAIGRDDYSELKNFSENYGVSISNSMIVLTGGYYANTTKYRLLDSFRDGDFKITQKEYAEKFIKKLSQISKYLEDRVDKDREFLKALEKTYRSGVTQEHLLDKFEKSGKRIRRSSGFKEYIREIEDVISYRSAVVVRIPKNIPVTA